jgi:hypothetical protein
MISCTDPVSGLKVKTGEMDYNTSAISIKEAINAAIPFLVDNVEVIQSYKYTHDQNGKIFHIVFRDIHSNPAQCTLESGTVVPMTGQESADTEPVPTLKFLATTPRAYG